MWVKKNFLLIQFKAIKILHEMSPAWIRFVNFWRSYCRKSHNFNAFLRGGSTVERENRAYFSEMNCKGSTKDINTNFFYLKVHPFTLNLYFCKFSNMNSATLERLWTCRYQEQHGCHYCITSTSWVIWNQKNEIFFDWGRYWLWSTEHDFQNFNFLNFYSPQ